MSTKFCSVGELWDYVRLLLLLVYIFVFLLVYNDDSFIAK